MHNHWPVWSPDGRWIYFARGNPVAATFDLWRISPSGGKPERLTNHNSWVAHPAPLGPSAVLYVARDEDGSGPWLWALNPDNKSTRRVSFGLEQYTSVAASANGRRLVATVANPSANLWSVPIQDHPASERDVTPFPLPTVRALAPRFSGSSLFYLSSHGTGDGVWRYDQRKAIEIWKGADGPLFGPVAVSPDGSQVAIGLRTGGKLRLHLITADGANLRPLSDEIEIQGAASWSPDGQWIVTGGRDAHGLGLFKIPAAGGPPTRIVAGQAFNPVWSPDGSLIVYTGANVGADAPLLAVRPDRTPVAFPAIRVLRDGERARFLPSGKGLVYMQGRSAAQDFWLLDLASHQSRRLTHLQNTSAMQAFDITPDGKHIVFDRLRENSDLVLIDREK
jgi:Tol biopolymer transport system component